MRYTEPYSGNIPDETDTKRKLVSLLKQKRVVLMAGAGSSCIAGFPQWEKLIRDLNNQLDNTVNYIQ